MLPPNGSPRSTGLARWIAPLAALVVVAIVPLYATPYTNQEIALVLAYAVAIAGLDVLVGHTGQVSLGQSAFFGLGAYCTGYGVGHGWGAPVSLLVAIGLTALVGALVGIPAVRLRGFAFGIVTLALPVVAVPLADRLISITGGSEGLSVVTVTAPSGVGLANDQWRVYVCAAVAAGVLLFVGTAMQRRTGRALAAIRVHRAMAVASGVPIIPYEILAFTIAAMCAGAGGWMYVVAFQFISPATLQLTLSVSLLVALVVGGLRSRLGSLLGGAFLVITPSITDKISPGRSYLVYGVCLLVVLLLFPSGMAGAFHAAARRITQLAHRIERGPVSNHVSTEEVSQCIKQDASR
jgi:branched-chain amino acid transport system permease protein